MRHSPVVGGFDRFGRHGEVSDYAAGMLLISELSCTACHATEQKYLEPKRGPSLTGAGLRLRGEWVADFLADPRSAKSGSTMPHVIAGLPEAERESSIQALVAFLATQQQPFPEIKAGGATPVIHEFWNHGDPERGAKLYHSVGCVACHKPDESYETVETKPSAMDELMEQLDPEDIEELGLADLARRVESIPHPKLPDKYSARSLTLFLLAPDDVRSSARMPSLRLDPAEAADITAYLLGGKRDQSELWPSLSSAELIEKGKALFVELQCAACHDAQNVKPQSPAKRLEELEWDAAHNCLDAPSGAMARFSLDETQRNAIRVAVDRMGARELATEDAVLLGMMQRNCFACHRRDGIGGVGRYRKAYFETVGHVDLGDEGRLPPSLDGVGRKLQPKALAAVFHPRTAKHRSYMTARMPTYSSRAVEDFVKHVPTVDGANDGKSEKVFAPLAGLAEPGRELIDTGCVGCHAFRGESLPGVVGIDLAGITQRIRPQWFYEFVRNPNDLKERSRMPTFFPNGESNRKDVLGGDVHQQISSIWAYLDELESQPLPNKIDEARSANYVLSPHEHPLVLRTFMKDAGTHAIAVGFPNRLHYAFDAERVRLAIGWKGRFLDARSTWFERFAPAVAPMGDSIARFPAVPLIQTNGESEAQFNGYRLDASKIPTLLYQFGRVRVEDRMEASDEATFRRTLSIDSADGSTPIVLQLLSGQHVKRTSDRMFVNDEGLVLTIPARLSESAKVTREKSVDVVGMTLTEEGPVAVEVEYRW